MPSISFGAPASARARREARPRMLEPDEAAFEGRAPASIGKLEAARYPGSATRLDRR
jgi:hypothetical protein